MLSSPIRFRAGFFGYVLAIVVLIAVLAVQRGICTAADEPASAGGHRLAMRIGRSSRPENTAQPPNLAQPNNPAQAEKATDLAKRVELEKKAESDKKTSAAGKGAADTVGEPMAAGMMELLRDEIVTGIQRRGISDRYARFQSYAIGKLNSSAGRYTGSELAGNCRLKWYDHMMRNMLSAPAEAERFTRDLHMAVLFLASKDADYMNGTIMNVDGGWLAR